MSLTVKRGKVRLFCGANWKLVKDSGWLEHKMYVPNLEIYVGNRAIDGVEHAVFQCKDGDYIAQPVAMCELPRPDDELENVST